MLSVVQTRTIQWDRDVAALNDAEMVAIANAMLNIPSFWADLSEDDLRSGTVSLGERSKLVMCFCLDAEDDILLQIVNVQ